MKFKKERKNVQTICKKPMQLKKILLNYLN